MNEIISVVIPIYNVEKYLHKCVDSVLNQTYQNLEIILVDDGSPDGCGKICDEYAQKDARIRVIHQKNRGLSGARNTGIDVATGEFLAFVDSDDYIEPEMYATLMKDIEEHQADIAITNRFYEFEDGKQLERYKSDGQLKVFTGLEALVEMNSFKSFDMAAWDKLYRREVFGEIRYPEGKLSEDFFIVFRLFDRASKVTYNPKQMYHYMQRQNSISRNKKINWDFIEASKEQLQYIKEKHPELLGMAQTAYASAVMTVYNFHIKNHVKCPKEKRIEMQQAVKENLGAVKANENLPKVKKIQASLFASCIDIYNITFIILRKVKEV